MVFRELKIDEKEMVPFKDELIEKPKLLVSDSSNEYFDIGVKYASKFSSDPSHKLASIIVKNGVIIGIGTNSSEYHEKYGCRRKDENGKSLYKSGEGYDVCPGCNPKTSHSELIAIRNSIIFKLFEESINNEKVVQKYGKFIDQIVNGRENTNFMHDIDNYELFLTDMENLMGKKNYNIVYSNVQDQLKGSTLYLYGHYWACETCWNNCKNFGIESIIVKSESFGEYRER